MNTLTVPMLVAGLVLAAACATGDSQTDPATPTPTDEGAPSASVVMVEPEETEAPIEGPNPERMVLTLDDLPDGAEIYSELAGDLDPIVDDYSRVFGPGVGEVGESTVLLMISQALLFDDVLEAGFEFAYQRRLARSQNAEPAFIAEIADSLDVEPTTLTTTTLEGKALGDQSIAGRVMIEAGIGQLDFTYYYIRVGPVFETVSVLGFAGDIHQEDVERMAEIMAQRTAAELAAYE